MPLIVNGYTIPVPDPPTLETLMLALEPERPYAVARNEEFVPRAKYAECRINPGDRIAIVHASAGG